MKVCGFSFVRNAIKYGYPIVESIQSILPVCDHFVILVGQSDDATLDLIKSIGSEKIQIIGSIWDESLKKGGEVLSVETNKAFDTIPQEYDWCFYLQADEVVHESCLPVIQDGMQRWKDDLKVEGLLFKYRHFWGTYDYIASSRQWYRREIRVIRNDKSIRSYRDAQGFRKNNKKLNIKLISAYIFHYGWVKNPSVMYQKLNEFGKLWHGDDYSLNKENDMIDYSNTGMIHPYKGTHPEVMLDRINKLNWHFEVDLRKCKTTLKDKLLNAYEKLTGYRLFEYKNYKII